MGAQALQLDPTLRSVESRDFEGGLRRKIVGQDEAVQAVVDLYQVFRAGLEFNNPLIVRKTRVHAGAMPKRWSFLDVANPHVVVSALKPSRGGEVAVRVYEAAGQPARGVRMHFARRVAAARAANLIEDSGEQLPVRDNAVSFDLQPYEIKTFRVQLEDK